MISVRIVASSPIVQRGLSSLCIELGLRPDCFFSDQPSLEEGLGKINVLAPAIWIVEDFFYYLASQIEAATPDSLFVLYSHSQYKFDAGEVFCGEVREGKDAKIQLEAIVARYISISCNNLALYAKLKQVLNQRHCLILFLISHHFQKATICKACGITSGTYNNYVYEIRRHLNMELHEMVSALFLSGLFNELRRSDAYSSKLAICREIEARYGGSPVPYAS